MYFILSTLIIPHSRPGRVVLQETYARCQKVSELWRWRSQGSRSLLLDIDILYYVLDWAKKPSSRRHDHRIGFLLSNRWFSVVFNGFRKTQAENLYCPTALKQLLVYLLFFRNRVWYLFFFLAVFGVRMVFRRQTCKDDQKHWHRLLSGFLGFIGQKKPAKSKVLSIDHGDRNRNLFAWNFAFTNHFSR